MKKSILFCASVLLCSSLFAASYSYKNNTYQRLADEYTKKADAALDAGEYDLSVEYAIKAEENAALSKAFIEKMLARSTAEENMKLAEKKLNWAKSIKADKNFPMAFSSSQEAFDNSKAAFEKEDFASADSYALAAIAALEGVHEVTPLPQFYVVRPWAETKDCYWNISGRKYVYNNPLLWENLYQKNKEKQPKPSDPNLILPGMKMEIPSLTGEYREGTYSPNKNYDAYSATK